MTAKLDAISHIEAAIDTGVRGQTREFLLKALDSAKGKSVRNLTALDYENIAVGAKLNDPNRSGLIMRHGKRTGKIWIYRHNDPKTGKKVERQFGTFPALGLADARIKWSELREALRTGVEPVEVADVLTIGELIDKYIADYAQPTKRSWKMDETYLEKYVRPNYGNLPATQFTAQHVREILIPLTKRAPREAEKVRGVLSGMFNVATKGSRKIGNLDADTWLPADTFNPVSTVMLPQRKVTAYVPSEADLRAVLKGCGSIRDVGQAIHLQALTCSRVTEVLGMTWDEVQGDVWVLPSERSKNGHEHRVMLSSQAITLLKARQSDSPFVFPSERGDTHIIRNAVGRSLQKMEGVPNGFTSHKLRHLCLTWLAEHGAGKEIRDRVSNHVENTSIDSIYNHASLNGPAREWLQKWADYLDSLVVT
ncbi:tyrosine-type recombinase/integrase [Falsihalocynthiibacter sp. BN13B15]|uniref:tyrosine-type recombinase/integrase n=1 Tax=Falsihalocynthiibacter sp. BN13B15 TaxID=3240871 RepID=UPI00350F82E8